MDLSSTTPSSAQQQQSQQQLSQAIVPPSAPQVRSRVTLVCAECKRLKLKCDRKSPCGSCEKRETVARCIYSPAAAEKVDLHSLNNRLSAVEAQLSQLGSSVTSRSCIHQGGSCSGVPSDRALTAVGHSGSSLTIPLDDVTAIWLDQLDLNKDIPSLAPSNSPMSPPFAPYSPSQIKPENPPYPDTTTEIPGALLVPPPGSYYPHNSYQPSITPDLVRRLPSSMSKRRKLYNSVEEILTMNPCFHWKHFRERIDWMFKWAADMEAIQRAGPESRSGSPRNERDFVRSTFSGEPTVPVEPRPTVSFFAAAAGTVALGAQANRDQDGNEPTDDNAMAVDNVVLLNGRPLPRRTPSVASSSQGGKKPRTMKSSHPSKSTASPAMLFALSEQALDIFEKSNTYDLDYLVALIMQALYMLHDGKPVMDHRIYPLVGKMVNVARTMGLGMDPDEFPGKYSLFDAETRRRIWWEIYCYDLYVSDSMGHPPAIPDNSFTTKMPVDVDENLFSPSSALIPVPSPDDHASKYRGLKLRMAQIVKSVKKRTFKDPLTESSSPDLALIEEAASFESEVTQFLLDLPPAFKLDIDVDLSIVDASPSPSSSSQLSADSSGRRSPSSACLIAQQCELVITAQRLILKIYLPFLRPAQSGSTTCNASHNQAALGTINAAHAIIYASRVLHTISMQPPGGTSRHPGPAIFDYYSFGRALFDAAVVCAHSVIIQPAAIWSKVALDDIVGALQVMKDPAVATGRSSMRAGVECSVSEPVKVVEMLNKKAVGARAGSSSSFGSNPGAKRKHAEVETDVDHSLVGIQLPYAGAAVASTGPVVGSQSSPTSASSPPDAIQSSNGVLCTSSEGTGVKRSEVEKTKSRKAPYPMVGVRARSGKESPLTERRERADSSASTSSFIDPDARMYTKSLLTSGQSTLHISTPAPTNHGSSYDMPEPALMYPSRPSTEWMQAPIQTDTIPGSHAAPFPNADDQVNLPSGVLTVHEVNIQQHSYPSGTPTQQMPMYDKTQCNSFTTDTGWLPFRPGSGGQQASNRNLSFAGSDSSAPFVPVHDTGMLQSYKSTMSNSPSSYFAPPPFQPSFDNVSQSSLLDMNLSHRVSMDNAADLNGSHPPSSGDMIFDPKPLNGNALQLVYGDTQGQGQLGWQQGNGNGTQFWPPEYFSA